MSKRGYYGRHRNAEWTLLETDDGTALASSTEAGLAVMMDIRAALWQLRDNMSRAGALLHEIHRSLKPKPVRISKRRAAIVLARARNRKRKAPDASA